MNLLTDSLPSTVNICGEEVAINTDFKTWLRIVLALDDNELPPQEKIYVLLVNAYPVQPNDIQAAVESAKWFLNGGREYKGDAAPRVVSFDKDAPLIYAAFRQTHGVDLTIESLHWWQFLALMQGLDPESNFRHLVNLRALVKSGKATKEQRAAAAELGDVFEVEDVDGRSMEEKEEERKAHAEFLRLVEEGERKRGEK